jgi:hypothetical protein
LGFQFHKNQILPTRQLKDQQVSENIWDFRNSEINNDEDEVVPEIENKEIEIDEEEF